MFYLKHNSKAVRRREAAWIKPDIDPNLRPPLYRFCGDGHGRHTSKQRFSADSQVNLLLSTQRWLLSRLIQERWKQRNFRMYRIAPRRAQKTLPLVGRSRFIVPAAARD